MAEFFARARLDELEVEFRAQIDTVLAAGLMPTHLDWHSIRIHRRPEILDVMSVWRRNTASPCASASDL